MKLSNCPIVYIYYGNPDYIKYSISFAKRFCGDNFIILSDHKEFPRTNTLLFSQYENNVIKFIKSIYKHISTNGYNVELFCFLRWFYILEFMKAEGINRVFHCDTDVAIVKNATEIIEAYSQYELVATSGNGSKMSPHCLFVNRNVLESLCDYMIFYIKNGYKVDEQKVIEKINRGEPSAINDMSALTKFYYSFIGNKLDATNKCHNFLDHNINCKERFCYDDIDSVKSIYIQNGQVFFKEEDGSFVDVATIHFQGQAKNKLELFYRSYYYSIYC